MNDQPVKPAAPKERDYSETLFLPKTDFPMRAGLPQREPQLLRRWAELDLYRRLREVAKGRPRFVLHDGPPYANGNIHIGHALNKIMKDLVVRSQQMLGHDSNYVPGWDCHGLPIEWKIEEEYRARGKDKDAVDIVEFRRECRAFAARWMDVQREEFKRLGVEGDWDRPYATMDFPAEAQIAREIMAFAMSDQLYRGSKPVMWSAVEKTALAEAEIEYHEKISPTVVVKFPIVDTLDGDLAGAAVLIWTTTPWTIPANRAVTYGPGIEYGLYRVTEAPADNWAKAGDRYVVADKLAGEVFGAARVTAYERVKEVLPAMIARLAHPFRALPGANGFWDFDVPVFPADYVTDDAGTGFVHTAPGHGADDYNTFVKHKETFAACGTPEVPHTVGEDSSYLPGVPLFAGARIYDDKGKDAGANEAVISEARRGRRAPRPRAPQASVPAFLALEGAADLPQHAAMVHRHGQGDRRPGGYAAPSRACRDQDGAMGAAAGAEPDHRHDRGEARLGDLAPARLGLADRDLRRARHRPHPQGRARQRGDRRRLRGGGRGRLVCGRRGGAVPQALRLRSGRLRAGPDGARRLVRTRARRTPSRSRSATTSRRAAGSRAGPTR